MTDSHEPTSPATDDADTANTDSPQSPPQSAWVFWGGVTGASLIIALAVAVIISASSTSNSLSAATSGTPNSALSSFTSLKAIAPDINSKSATMLQLAPVQGASIVAPPFFLTDQSGKQMTLAKFAGRPIVLTFNDDRCTDICTLLAQDVAAANRDLGSTAKKIAFVSINTNPYYPTVSDVKTWTDNHGLGDATNWYYGTGSPTQLAQVAAAYKMQIELNTADRTVAHGTGIYFIDPTGHDVALGEFGTDSADTAPFSHALAQMAEDLLPIAQRRPVGGPSLATPGQKTTAIGDSPSPISLPDLTASGATLTSATDLGKFTVVNFWASTCTACVGEMPDLQKVATTTAPKVAFLGVDVSDDQAAARAFATGAGITYPLASDAAGATSGRFQITGLPYTVVLDPTGKVIVRHPGALTADQLDYILYTFKPSLAPK